MKRSFLLLTCLLSANVFAQSVSTTSTAFKGKNIFDEKVNLGTDYLEPNANYFSSLSVIFTAPAIQSNARTSSGDCNGMNNYESSFKKVDELKLTFMKMACQEADKVKANKKLDPQICVQLASCLATKLKASDSDRYEVLRAAREKTAEESIALVSRSTVNQMINFEELKAYAFQKYGADDFPEECTDVDALEVPESGCRTSIIDKGFDIAQKICKVPDNGCHADYADFIKDKKTIDGKSSLLREFIKSKSLTAAKNYMGEDFRLTQEIARLLTDNSLAPKKRVEKVMSYLKENQSNLDPVFKSYFEKYTDGQREKGTDDVSEGLLKYIQSNESKGTLEVMVDLDRLRRNEAHEMLKNKCGKVLKMDGLCKIAKDVMLGAEVVVPERSFNQLMLRKDNNLAQDPKMSREDLIQYVSRCNTFVLDSSGAGRKGVLTKLASDRDLFTSGDDAIMIARNVQVPVYNIGLPSLGIPARTTYTVDSSGSISKKESLFSNSTVNISSSATEKSSDTVLVKKFSNNIQLADSFKKSDEFKGVTIRAADKLIIPDLAASAKKDEISKVGQFSDSVNSLQVATPQTMFGSKSAIPNPKSADSMIDSSMVDFSPNKADRASAKNNSNVDYNQLLGKISGLEEKLAQAQKKSVESEKDTDVKVDAKSQEENDLIKELKNAKTTLNELTKNNSEKEKGPDIVNNVLASRSNSNTNNSADPESDASIISSGGSMQSTSASRSVAAVASASSSRANNVSEAAGERSSGGSEESSRPSSSRVSSSGSVENSSASNMDGVILTRLDGIGHVKVNETINNLITSESGKPFYIEEGGLVKQIIPEVVDGKILLKDDGTPVYKTIVKGKVGQFKIDSKEKNKKEIVKINSPADVKMQDYQVTAPAVRYRELQEAFMIKK